jgi:hypothetical protein
VQTLLYAVSSVLSPGKEFSYTLNPCLVDLTDPLGLFKAKALNMIMNIVISPVEGSGNPPKVSSPVIAFLNLFFCFF